MFVLQFSALNILCRKHKQGYIPYGNALYMSFREGPKWFRWAAVPSYIIVNTFMIVFQFISMCLYYQLITHLIVKMCNQSINKYQMAICVFPIIVLIYFINSSRIISLLSIMADFMLMAVFCMIIYIATNLGIKPHEPVAYRGAGYIPGVVCTSLFNLETTGVVRRTVLPLNC